jgi:hypothetical protein
VNARRTAHGLVVLMGAAYHPQRCDRLAAVIYKPFDPDAVLQTPHVYVP